MVEQDLIAISANGLRVGLRRHALGALAGAAAPGLCYEPSLVAPEEAARVPLTLKATSFGFEWNVAGAAALTACGIRDGKVVGVVQMPLSGSSCWEQWPGCAAVDLVPTDTAGRVAGESARLRQPQASESGRVIFVEAGEGRVCVQPSTPHLAACRLLAWHRVQERSWNIGREYGAIGAGLLVEIPAYQGGFAVESSGRLLTSQAFAFGRLHQTATADRAEMERLYPVAQERRDIWDDWPAWLRDGVVACIEPFAQGGPPPADAAGQVAWLRTVMRRALLGRYFPEGFDQWRPDAPIEQFAASHWPALAGVLALGPDAAALRLALDLRESSRQLEESVAWADGRGTALWSCLRLWPQLALYRKLAEALPASAGSRNQLAAFGGALGRIPSEGARAEADVVRLREELDRAVAADFGATPDSLNSEAFAPFAYGERLRTVAAELGLKLPTRTVANALPELAAALADLGKGNPAESVEALHAAAMLSDERYNEWRTRVQGCRSLLESVTQAIPARVSAAFPADVAGIEAAARNPEVAADVACRSLERGLRADLAANWKARVQAARLEESDCPLPACQALAGFLSAVADGLGGIEAARREMVGRQAAMAALRRHLGPGVEPSAAPAELARCREAVRVRALGLAGFSEDLPVHARQDVSRALEEIGAGGQDSLEGMREQCERLESVGGSLDSAQAALATALATPPMSRTTIEIWLREGQFELARRASVLLRQAYGRLELKAESAQWLWIGVGAPWADSLISVRRALGRIGPDTSIEDLDRLQAHFNEYRSLVLQAGGLPNLLAGLEAEAQRRWADFRESHLVNGARLLGIEALGSLLRTIGIDHWGPAGPRIGQQPWTPDGVSREQVREWLEAGRLLPPAE